MKEIFAGLFLAVVLVMAGWSAQAQCPQSTKYDCKNLQGSIAYGQITVTVGATQCGGMPCCLPVANYPFDLVSACMSAYPDCKKCMACPTEIWNPASAYSQCIKLPGS